MTTRQGAGGGLREAAWPRRVALLPPGPWDEAYRRFETPEAEQAKFKKRLRALGVEAWSRDLRVTELFCGRGNALFAWQELGFSNLEGLDISFGLLADYRGPARVHVGDARRLPFPAGSRDVVSVHGGLHHLALMRDLEAVLAEIHRVLVPRGRLLLVEPWLTPSLHVVHALCRVSALRRVWGRLDALATMIDLERPTYEDWLSRPAAVLDAIVRVVEPVVVRIRWGKLMLLATRRDSIAPANGRGAAGLG